MAQDIAYREAGHAVAACMLRRQFDQIDCNGSFARALEETVIRDAASPIDLQDDETVLMAGRLFNGEADDRWASKRADRLVRRYDFAPMVREVHDALVARGELSFAEVTEILRTVRRRIDTASMEHHPLFAAAV